MQQKARTHKGMASVHTNGIEPTNNSDSQNTILKYINLEYFALYLSLVVSLLALLSALVFDHYWLLKFIEEDGPIENLTVFFYGVTVLCFLFYRKAKITIGVRISAAVILLNMAARELDLHKSLGTSMLKSKFWLSSTIPMSDRLFAFLILAPLAVSCFYLLTKYGSSWLNNLKQRKNYAFSVMFFFVILIVSKCFDRSVNVLDKTFHFSSPIWLVALIQSQEEYLECLLPVLLIVALFQFSQTGLRKIK